MPSNKKTSKKGKKKADNSSTQISNPAVCDKMNNVSKCTVTNGSNVEINGLNKMDKSVNGIPGKSDSKTSKSKKKKTSPPLTVAATIPLTSTSSSSTMSKTMQSNAKTTQSNDKAGNKAGDRAGQHQQGELDTNNYVQLCYEAFLAGILGP